MTEALTTLSKIFEGKEIRVIEKNGEVWLRLDDLAGAWGIDRTTPQKIISRNEEVFEGLHLSVAVGDVTSPDVWNCVNERGLYLIMGKISASRLKNKESRAAIIRFQRWVPELIQQYRKKEIVQAKQPSLDAELTEAIHIAEVCKKSPDPFLSAVLEKYGKKHLAVKLETRLLRSFMVNPAGSTFPSW